MAQLMAPDRREVENIVRSVLGKHFGLPAAAAPAARNPLVVNISARHVHLTQEHVEILFGKGAQLEPQKRGAHYLAPLE